MKPTEEIDIISLYAKYDSAYWNAYLTKCLNNLDMAELLKTRRGLQVGMANAEKKKLVNEAIANTWCRWIGSLDKTIRKVVKAKDKLRNDGVGTAENCGLDEKRTRDGKLESFLRRESY